MTSHLNSYQPPGPPLDIPFECHLNTPPDRYDHNFSGGPVYTLSTDRLTLVPFVPSLHGKQYYHDIKEHGHLMKYMPYPRRMDESLDNLLFVYEKTIRSLPGSCLWALFDLTKVGNTEVEDVGSICPLPQGHPPLNTFAGVMGMLVTDRDNLVSEIGHVMILPRAQRSHVTTHAIALIEHYALDHPYMARWSVEKEEFVAEDVPGDHPPPLAAPFDANYPAPRGLGLRRLQWQAHHLNDPSTRLAQRMMLREEGRIRMQRIAPTGGEEGRLHDGGATTSRTSWVGALTWRDWEDPEVQKHINAQVARR